MCGYLWDLNLLSAILDLEALFRILIYIYIGARVSARTRARM
jgi:hypothetical protein